MTAPSNSTAGLRSFAALRSFQSTDRFITEATGKTPRAGYVLLGDDAFLLQRARCGILDALVPADLRDFSLHDLDLAETSIFEALDLAQTPSLMAPFQVFFIRNIKTLYGRGQKKDEFAAIDDYFRRPNPQALIIFIADHIRLPQDVRTMDMQDKERAEKIRETLGDACGIIELQRVNEDDAIQWAIREAESQHIRLTEDAARELVDALGAEMLTLSSELSKLVLYAQSQNSQTIELADVETMVSAAKQRSLYELTDAISLKDAPRAVALLHGLLNSSESGEDAAIGHIFTLAKTFRQMLVLNEKQVRDQRAMWQVLWPGFRVAPFAADALIAQARRYRDRTDLTRGLELIARADAELRSSPADKRLVLERLVLRLAGGQNASQESFINH
jgi:DNA polymerase-3 subunit delta